MSIMFLDICNLSIPCEKSKPFLKILEIKNKSTKMHITACKQLQAMIEIALKSKILHFLLFVIANLQFPFFFQSNDPLNKFDIWHNQYRHTE